MIELVRHKPRSKREIILGLQFQAKRMLDSGEARSLGDACTILAVRYESDFYKIYNLIVPTFGSGAGI